MGKVLILGALSLVCIVFGAKFIADDFSRPIGAAFPAVDPLYRGLLLMITGFVLAGFAISAAVPFMGAAQ